MQGLSLHLFSTLVLGCLACCKLDAGLPEHDRRPEDAEAYARYAELERGDSVRGQQVFQSGSAGCTRCHVVGGTQRKAGPNLLGIAEKLSRTQLVEAVLQPSAEVLAGYAVTAVVTNSGTVYSGIIEKRSAHAIELFVASGEIQAIALGEVAQETTSFEGGVSLMPEGIHRSVTLGEFADLVAYLETLESPEVAQSARRGTPMTIEATARPIRLESIHGPEVRFHHPVWFEPLPRLPNLALVVDSEPARIWLLDRSTRPHRKTLFVDLSDEVHTGEYTGIMGLALHPRFLQNRRYYVNYHVLEDGAFATLVVERRATADLRRDAGVAAREILRIDQSTDIHTGGMLVFGPDGFLYVGTGDGGPQTDPTGRAQSLRTLSGAILRVDVDRRQPPLNYSIPDSNPFVHLKDPLVRREIFARGLRQAWRFSFDSLTHDLWVGDVGQNRFEEICLVRAGENHGWNVYEGFLPFSDRFRLRGETYVPPVVAIARHHGTSVTGGYVYRGTRSPSYYGVYIFGDYQSKRIWGLTHADRRLVKVRQIGIAPDRIVSFGTDADGEIYMVGYDQGIIYHLALAGSRFE